MCCQLVSLLLVLCLPPKFVKMSSLEHAQNNYFAQRPRQICMMHLTNDVLGFFFIIIFLFYVDI